MKISNKLVIVLIGIVLAVTLTIILFCVLDTDKSDALTDGVHETTAQNESTNNETENKSYEENGEHEFIPTPIPELNEGNEIYLDSDVIARLTEMELYGEEDLVNAILDGEMVLINSFVSKGYSLRAVRQVQRFYFHFYDDLKNESIESVVSRLNSCFTTEGVFEDSFATDAQRLFDFSPDADYSYIFDMEDSQ